MISNKIGCKYCTVQRYCENMIYCEAIQYFGSFHFIHSLVDGLHSVLLPLRLIDCLVQYPRLLMGYCISNPYPRVEDLPFLLTP